ncbi:MAG: ABC transporter ATP-binding protein [Alphaproteobacteria bacterium]|nr:ABC transporter ATP-binding protein [Alphaproteobacteria bacterium]
MPGSLRQLRIGDGAVRGEPLPRTVYGYLWRATGRHQLALSTLAVAVFLMSMGPLELQRRIVNDVIRGSDLETLVLLCGAYAGLALTMGFTKLCLNVYRGYVGEAATIDLRRRIHTLMAPLVGNHAAAEEAAQAEGVEIAMVISEVEPVGGFIGISISEPLLQGGILLTVAGYMVFLQPWMALASLLLFSPQLVFVPLLQRAINRRAAERIRVVREVSAGLIEDSRREATPLGRALFERRIASVFMLNMQIFRRKFLMNFLMNGTYHIGVTGILLVGGWFVITGRTEIGTVVAFLSGLAQLNDPWGDLINYFRESTTAQVKYRMIAGALDPASVARPQPGAAAAAETA